MASAREIQYIIKARDEATAIFKKMGMEGSDAANQISKAFDLATTSTSKHEKQVNSLTQWIRKDRMEKREHNYMYKQGTEVIGAASLALALYGNTAGQADEKSKKLTDSLNAGMVGFQGISTALFMLPGPVGIALGVLGGLAIMFKKITDNSEATAESIKRVNDETKAYYEGINLENTNKFLAQNEAVLASAEKNLNSLKSETKEITKQWLVRGELHEVKMLAHAASASDIKYAQMTVDAYKSVVGQLRAQKEALEQVEAVEKRKEAQKPAVKPAEVVKPKDIKDTYSVPPGYEQYLKNEAKSRQYINSQLFLTTKALKDQIPVINQNASAAEAAWELQKKFISFEREYTAAKQAETEIRIALTQMEIESAMQAYDASEALGTQINKAANEAIRAYIARAVAAQLASVFESVPFPFNLIAAPAAGLAVQALLESAIPKFARGTPPGGFMVPQGYPNDSFKIGVSSGEKVNVTPANRSGGGGNNITIHITTVLGKLEVIKLIKDVVRDTGKNIVALTQDNRRNLSFESQ